MWWLVIIGGAIYLLSSPKTSGESETQIVFPAIPGGKNLAFDKLPLNEYGLPVAIHVYSIDFPLKYGDTGNVIAVLQQMVNARNYGFTIPVTGIWDDSLQVALFDAEYSLNDFELLATAQPPIVGKVEVYDFKPGVK